MTVRSYTGYLFAFQRNRGQTETRHKTLIYNDVFGFKNINSTAFLLCSNFGAYKISGSFAKPLRKWNISTVNVPAACPSLIPHGKIRLPMVGISWNLYGAFLKKNMPRKFKFDYNQIKQLIGLLYKKASVSILHYPNEFFFYVDNMSIKPGQQSTTYIFSMLFSQNRAVYEKWQKYGRSDRPHTF